MQEKPFEKSVQDAEKAPNIVARLAVDVPNARFIGNNVLTGDARETSMFFPLKMKDTQGTGKRKEMKRTPKAVKDETESNGLPFF